MAAAVMQHPPEAPRDAGRVAQAAARHGRLRRQTSRIDESDNDCLIVCLEHWLEQLKTDTVGIISDIAMRPTFKQLDQGDVWPQH